MRLTFRILFVLTFPIWILPFTIGLSVWSISNEVLEAIEDLLP